MNQELGCIFPGQGSQKTGMLAELGAAFPLVRDTFDEASDVLSYDLWQLVQNDGKNELSKTSVTQPAILAASVAVWRLWVNQGGAMPGLMAGHSLGEYSALVCSGALGFADAVGLVRKRGDYMQSAVPEGVGGMAAVVGLGDEAVSEACARAAQGQVVAAVNFNSPGQVVIAGHLEALERAGALCREAGAKRVLPLPVSAPFHCELMRPAAERFAADLAAVTLHPPLIPVIQNFGLEAPSDVSSIRDNLVSQIFSPVPWVDTLRLFAARGVHIYIELGPGRVLSGLVRRFDPDARALAVNDPEGLRAALGQV